jgi:hypothetical protein
MSFENFNALDPPVENFADEVGQSPVELSTPARSIASRIQPSPSTPVTPMSALNISNLVAEFPTPQRQITKAALLENQAKNVVSPRQKRLQALLDTPVSRAQKFVESVSSPLPELPDCMKPTPIDYGLVPNSTPTAQWFHKRKLDGLDQNYEPRQAHKRLMREEKETELTPYSHRRYDFYKSTRLSDFMSPDPRLETQNLLSLNKKSNVTTNEASKFLNFNDETDEAARPQFSEDTADTFRDFRELEERASINKPKKSTSIRETDEPDKDKVIDVPRLESEILVEWGEEQHNPPEDDVERIFQFSGLSEKVSYEEKLLPVISYLIFQFSGQEKFI